MMDLEGAVRAFEAEWGDGDDYGDEKRTLGNGRRVIMEMMASHAKDRCAYEVVVPTTPTVSPGETTPRPHERHVEVDFRLLSGKPVMGIVDALVREHATGELKVLEYKTASQMWGNWGELWQLSPQVWTYVAALRVMGEDVTGGFVEGILVDKRKTAINVVPLEVGEGQVEQVLGWWQRHDSTLWRREQLDPQGEDPALWPMELCGCNPYAAFGVQGWQCEYAALCGAGSGWRELLGLYVQRKEQGEKE
jgi:hypothetical protein